MQTIPSVILKKEYVFFDLTCCINELYALHHELSMHDIDQINNACKKLRYFIDERQSQLNSAYQLSV